MDPLPIPSPNTYPDLAQLKQKLRDELLREMRDVEAVQTQLAYYTTVFSEAVMATPFPHLVP